MHHRSQSAHRYMYANPMDWTRTIVALDVQRSKVDERPFPNLTNAFGIAPECMREGIPIRKRALYLASIHRSTWLSRAVGA